MDETKQAIWDASKDLIGEVYARISAEAAISEDELRGCALTGFLIMTQLPASKEHGDRVSMGLLSWEILRLREQIKRSMV